VCFGKKKKKKNSRQPIKKGMDSYDHQNDGGEREKALKSKTGKNEKPAGKKRGNRHINGENFKKNRRGSIKKESVGWAKTGKSGCPAFVGKSCPVEKGKRKLVIEGPRGTQEKKKLRKKREGRQLPASTGGGRGGTGGKGSGEKEKM